MNNVDAWPVKSICKEVKNVVNKDEIVQGFNVTNIQAIQRAVAKVMDWQKSIDPNACFSY